MAEHDHVQDEHSHDQEGQFIIIPDEDGNEQEFEILMTFEVDESGQKYMMVVPADAPDEETEVYAFRYEEEGDDLQLFMIEEEEEWNMVEETFHTLMEEMEDEEQ